MAWILVQTSAGPPGAGWSSPRQAERVHELTWLQELLPLPQLLRSDARPPLLPSLTAPHRWSWQAGLGTSLFLEETLQKRSAPTCLVAAQGGVEHRHAGGLPSVVSLP